MFTSLTNSFLWYKSFRVATVTHCFRLPRPREYSVISMKEDLERSDHLFKRGIFKEKGREK